MPLSLAERVRERRNQRLAASQQRRESRDRGDAPLSNERVSSPSKGTSNGVLVPVFNIDATQSDPELTRPMSPEAKHTYRNSNTTRNMVSPLTVQHNPTRPPASPSQRSTLSAPTSPKESGCPPSPNSFRPVGSNRARNLYNSIPSSKHFGVITPHQPSIPYLSNSSPSWEEGDGIIPTISLSLRTDRSVSSELLPRLHSASHQGLPSGRHDNRSVFSDSNLDDEPKLQPRRGSAEVQMDERSNDVDSRRSVDEDDALMLRPRHRKMPSSVRLENHHPRFPPSHSDSNHHHSRSRMGGTVLAASPSMQEDDVSSLGGVEDQLSTASRTSLARLTAAVRSNTPRGLVAEERALWEAFQTSLAASRKAAYEEADPKMREKLKIQQEEQERSFRAIQRVLADVSEDRDRANTQAKESKQEQRRLQRQVEKLEEQVEQMRDSQRQKALEETTRAAASPEALPVSDSQLEELNKKIKNLEEDKEKMAVELDSRNKQLTKLKRHLHGKGDVIIEDSNGLKKELEERSAALENAKMIIASLENASGSLASDTRFKLKAKDSEILSLKTDARHQQKKLDNLATQLKEIQREKAQLAEERGNDLTRIAVWKATLRERLSEMQSAAVILEATRDDPSATQRFSEVVAEAMETMQKTVDALDSLHTDLEDDDDDESSRHPRSPGSRYDGSFPTNDMDSLASGRSANSRLSKDSLREIKHDLEEKATTVRRLEEELRKVREEAQVSRLEAEKIEKQRESDIKSLHGEIQMLRIQSSTNMELLAKKERELAVLRDSLKVEDDDVGYISDDATDIDDEDDEAAGGGTSLSLAKYNASQTEAIAALMAHGRSGSGDIPMPEGQATETDQLRYELRQSRLDMERAQKDLKIEKESLANAKMIISSLEKASKNMMEDLRSRLQESNSAIASLLEKSMESEKNTRKLETELDSLRKEYDELAQNQGGKREEEKKEEYTT